MIKVTRPTDLNGAELMDELNAAGVKITEPPMLDGNGELWLDIAQADSTKAQTVAIAHKGRTEATLQTIEQKLASVGLSVADLKEALGL